MQGPEGDWRQIAPRNSDRYIALVSLPREKAEFQFKMIDLAGNENIVKQVCPLFDPAALSGTAEPGRAVPATARQGESSPSPAIQRPTVARSAILKELELEFVPFGQFGEEMLKTEVNQKAWNAFVRDRLQTKVSEGDPRMAMVLGDGFDITLLTEFTRWLTEKSDDGYSYSLPSVSQWMTAFVGTPNPLEAKKEISRWFQGGDPGRRFNSSPKVRYGLPEVLKIGSRPENATPTGLLDMESNLQEIVLGQYGSLYVIGGYNQHRESELEHYCTKLRLYQTAAEDWASKFTGFRVLRKLKGN